MSPTKSRWREVVDEVLAAFGRLDILVNSAGIAVLGNIETTTLADWRKVNAVNAEGVFLGCREAVRAMKASGGGSIVNLSSVAGIIGDGSSLAYCASKGAVRLLTKSAALHCARAGYKIRVNSVHPSFAETPMVLEGIARAKDPARIRAGLERAAPMGRMGKAEEVANTILFLASDESSFTTGAEFMVDGGLDGAVRATLFEFVRTAELAAGSLLHFKLSRGKLASGFPQQRVRRAADGAAKLRGFVEGHGDDVYPALLDFLDELFVLRADNDGARFEAKRVAAE